MKDIQTKFDLSVGRQGRHKGGERCQRKNFGSQFHVAELKATVLTMCSDSSSEAAATRSALRSAGNYMKKSPCLNLACRNPNMRNPCSAACWQH